MDPEDKVLASEHEVSAAGSDIDSAVQALKAPSEQLYEKMLVNVSVYGLADKVDVTGLQSLVLEQFKVALSLGSWPYHEFPTIVLQILQLTPAHDKGLRDTVAEVCSRHVPELLGNADKESLMENDWASVLKEDADFSFAVLQHASRLYVSDIKGRDVREKGLLIMTKELRASEKSLQNKLTLKEDAQRELKRVSDKATSQYSELVTILSDTLISVHYTLSDKNRNPCSACKSTTMPKIARTPVDSCFIMSCRRCGHSVSVTQETLRKKVVEAFQSASPKEATIKESAL